jgi:eukaryotic-like serine/threonine-protein kinase
MSATITLTIIDGKLSGKSYRLADRSFGKGVELVHRDLKPKNIMIANTKLGQVAKIGDFGLSKAFDLAGLSGHTMGGDGFRGTADFGNE